jgi:hypothetical protein
MNGQSLPADRCETKIFQGAQAMNKLFSILTLSITTALFGGMIAQPLSGQ